MHAKEWHETLQRPGGDVVHVSFMSWIFPVILS